MREICSKLNLLKFEHISRIVFVSVLEFEEAYAGCESNLCKWSLKIRHALIDFDLLYGEGYGQVRAER